MKRNAIFAFALLSVLATGASAASLSGDPVTGSGLAAAVPVSALAMPSRWIDPSRLHVSTELTFGTGTGIGSGGLQVTRLSYQLGRPLAMRVSLGNAFGAGVRDDGKFFLEGLDVHYQPFRALSVNVQYRNVRSPLQLPYGYGYGHGYGYAGDPLFRERDPRYVP